MSRFIGYQLISSLHSFLLGIGSQLNIQVMRSQ